MIGGFGRCQLGCFVDRTGSVIFHDRRSRICGWNSRSRTPDPCRRCACCLIRLGLLRWSCPVRPLRGDWTGDALFLFRDLCIGFLDLRAGCLPLGFGLLSLCRFRFAGGRFSVLFLRDIRGAGLDRRFGSQVFGLSAKLRKLAVHSRNRSRVFFSFYDLRLLDWLGSFDRNLLRSLDFFLGLLTFRFDFWLWSLSLQRLLPGKGCQLFVLNRDDPILFLSNLFCWLFIMIFEDAGHRCDDQDH